MIRNYLKIALRNLTTNKVYSLINISGLATGMAVALLIGLWINDEISFNKSIDNYNRIGAVWQFVKFDAEKSSYDVIPVPMSGELRNNYPDVKSVSLSSPRGVILTLNDKKLSETGNYVEPSFPAMMSMEMVAGNHDGLKEVRSIMLSETLSKSLFGGNEALNQIVKINDSTVVKVSGVFKDFPENSQFKSVHFLAPWSLYEATDATALNAKYKWDDNNYNMYVQLNDKADFKSLSAKIKDIRMKRDNPPSYKPEFFVHPMSRWHLYGEFKNGVNTGGLITYVWLFASTGFFVLLLACINFMNLSTARSEKRAKEVGIRKTVGSARLQLITQFFIESLTYVVFAFVLSLILAIAAMPLFNEVSGKHISIFWTSKWFWLLSVIFILITAMVAGSYPAFYLSAFNPLKVLKGTFKAGKLAAIPRQVLVVLQFTVSVIMIIGTIIVFRQVQHEKNRPAGYDKDRLLEVNLTSLAIPNHFNAFYSDMINSGAVSNVAQSSGSITNQYGGTTDLNWSTKTPDQHPLVMGNAVSHEFGKTVGWTLKSGRDFSRNFLTDSSAIILNETAVQLMGLKNPLEEFIIVHGKKYGVIGVINDMIRASPFQHVDPTYYLLDYKSINVFNIKIAPNVATSDAINKIRQIFEKYDPSTPFAYQFVDEQYNKKFADQERIGQLSGFFAALAIIISCLGLFGLASFVAEQRTKEIAIRKTLGASIASVWKLLSTEFLILVGISLLLATPLAYFVMHRWLQDYEYRTTLSWWIFAMVGASSIILTILTVSIQALKAAFTNPVKSLRAQ